MLGDEALCNLDTRRKRHASTRAAARMPGGARHAARQTAAASIPCGRQTDTPSGEPAVESGAADRLPELAEVPASEGGPVSPELAGRSGERRRIKERATVPDYRLRHRPARTQAATSHFMEEA